MHTGKYVVQSFDYMSLVVRPSEIKRISCIEPLDTVISKLLVVSAKRGNVMQRTAYR